MEGLIDRYEAVEDAARDEVMAQGGCISHHHGVGKIRKKFMTRTVTPNAIEWQHALKKQIDPKNIFAVQMFINLYANSKFKYTYIKGRDE